MRSKSILTAALVSGLALAAARTRRIRLGPLVYLLPLYDPLRLIEEVAMLDQLSGGRLELGVGRGVSPYELRNFGVDPENSRAKMYLRMLSLQKLKSEPPAGSGSTPPQAAPG